MKSTGESILFIDDLKDDQFYELYSRRKIYLSKLALVIYLKSPDLNMPQKVRHYLGHFYELILIKISSSFDLKYKTYICLLNLAK
jgi:hypothetical protein